MSVVLVHGRCLTGAVWDLVAGELRGRGRRVEVVELHRGSLLADTEAVQEVVDLLGEPVVACGWSYGGMVITGLTLGSSSHLVYLCALMPAEGESAIELGSRYPGGLAALVDTDEAGDVVLRGDQVDEILWADAPSETAAVARTMLRPQAMQSFLEAPPRVAWRQTPSTYVVGRRPGLPPPARRRDGIEGGDRHRMGHEPLPAADPPRPCRRPTRPNRRWLVPSVVARSPARAPSAARAFGKVP